MASEATKLRKILEDENNKQIPDEELIYALRIRLPYANTVDTEKLQRGTDKISRLLNQSKRGE